MADVADQLDGIVDDLFCIVDALELRRLVEVDQVFIKVKPGGGKEGPGIVVQVCGDPLAFLFLEANAGVEEQFLLVLLHPLQTHLVANDFPLVKDNEDNEPDSKRQHSDSAKEKHGGDGASGTGNL